MVDGDTQAKEFLARIKSGDKLSEEELSDLVWLHQIFEEEIAELRWGSHVKTIVLLDGEHYAVEWFKGATEMQENEFENQPYPVEKVEKVVTITEWVPVKD